MITVLQTIKDSTYSIPDQKGLLDIVKSKWLEMFDSDEVALAYSNKVSLILELDIDDPSNIVQMYLDDGEWNQHEITEAMLTTKKNFSFLIDPNVDENQFEWVSSLLLMIQENSVYNDIRAIIDGNEVKITDFDRV